MEQTDKNIQRWIAGIRADVSSEPERADKPDRAEKEEKEKKTGRREKQRYRMEEDDNSIYEYDLVCLNGKWENVGLKYCKIIQKIRDCGCNPLFFWLSFLEDITVV